MIALARFYRSIAVLSTILAAVGIVSVSGAWVNAPQAPASADALCDAMRERFGPGYPCISIPTNTFTPTAPNAAPTTTGANGQPNSGGPQVGSNIGPGPGEGNGTPIVPVPSRSVPGVPATPPVGVPTAPPVPAATPQAQVQQQAPAQAMAPAREAERPYGEPGDCGSDELPAIPDKVKRTPEQEKAYQRLRTGTTLSGKRRTELEKEVAAGKWPGYSADTPFQMDHIVSIDRLVRTPGFLDLSPEAQDKVTNAPSNTRPLRPLWNRSKLNNSYSQWPKANTPDAIGGPSESEWKELCKEEEASTSAIVEAIGSARSDGSDSDNRAGAGNGDNQAQSGSGGNEQLTRTVQPNQQQNAEPTEEPTYVPTEQPTYVPTEQPTYQPTEIPTQQPTPAPTTQTTLPLPPRLPTTSAPSTPPTFNLPGVTATAKDPSTWQKIGDAGRDTVRIGGTIAQAGADTASDAVNGAADRLQGAADSNAGNGADSGVGAGVSGGVAPLLGSMLAW